VADDFDAVRAELGVDRLDLWGNSYGTYLMPVYAARHPEHVRSMVLSGAYPIDFDPWGRDRAAAARRAIGLICARTHGCHGDRVLRDVAALATRLRHHPVTFDVAVDAKHFRGRLDNACAGTGAPPPLALTAPVRAAGLAPVKAPSATPAERRALAVIVATASDLQQQVGMLQGYRTASGLRSGRYVRAAKGVVWPRCASCAMPSSSGRSSRPSAGSPAPCACPERASRTGASASC
jgi:pimeloyl-ACP methyl ester carboxylesterase